MNDSPIKRLTVGILAHVDAGKTTLSEGLLFRTGQIRKLGRVDHGNAFLDTNTLERERGITIFSKQAILSTDRVSVTLLDTPGHVDFSTEAERTLQALDCALLVIGGTDGVQSHTETLWRLLRRSGVPVMLFVNKMDMPGTDRDIILSQLKGRLGDGFVDFGRGRPAGDGLETLAVCDEPMMNAYLDTGDIPDGLIAAAVEKRKVFPVYFGSALKLEGLDALLDGLTRFMPEPPRRPGFGAVVYKITRDENGNRLTWMKLTGGSLRVRTMLTGITDDQPWSEKVSQLRVYSGVKYAAPEEVFPGQTCAVTGLTMTRPGMGLGAEPDAAEPMLEPVLTYRVEPPSGVDAHTALARLRMLEEEDPQLHVVWSERLQEIHVRLMGEIQLEVLRRVILDRFGMAVQFGQGSIVYKETIADTVEGVGHFEPLRHYAEVHLLLQPLPRGSGLRFTTACSEDELGGSWQRLVLTHLFEKTHLGVLTGSPITDMKITLAAGRAHLKHTEGGDFRQATYRAVRQGLRQAKSILLEPWYDFRLEIPGDAVGRAMTDLQRMAAVFGAPELSGETAVLSGQIPVSEVRGYTAELVGYTRGAGRLVCQPCGFLPCHDTERVVREIGYDPDADLLNTADSVFCSHGAGHPVPWDQVPQYMHLESVLDRRPKPKAAAVEPRRVSEYVASMAADKELMAIFERTYGPIKRDERFAMRSAPKKPARSAVLPDKVSIPDYTPDEPEYLLVDGYNIIFAWDRLAALARESLDSARQQLIHTLCNYQGIRQCELIVVFDAYRVKGNPGEVEKFHNISVVYTKEAETADMYIEKVTKKLGRRRRVRVATSDGLEQLIILSHGAFRVSATAFLEEVAEAEAALREYLQ